MFKTTRTVYFENNKKKITTKKYETYKRAKAYAKRYSKLVNGARFVEVEIKFDTDSFKFKNVDIFVADSNGFENEHLEEIEKFQKETEEQNVKYTVSRFACSPEKEFDTVGEARLFAEECAKNYGFVYTINKVQGTTAQVIEEIEPQKSEKRYNFYVKDYTEKRDVPIVYSDYTKKEIIKEVQGWADKNNHVYKIFIADKTSDKALAGRVFFKVINWKPIFKVGKTGSRLQFGEFSYEDAGAYCKEYARKDGIAYTIYEIKFDKFGRDELVPVTDIEPSEKDVVPAYGVEQHTHYELEYNEYDETGYMVGENEAKFKTLEEATACADELIKNVGENNVVLRLYKVAGEDFECLFTKRASRIHGLVAIAEDKPGQTVAETQAKYTADNITDSELISMLVKEPVNASLYDFMREPQKVKISKEGRKRLNAVRDIVKRALVALPEEKKFIGTPKDAVDIMMRRLRYETKENFYVLILNTGNRVINVSKISQGSVNAAIVNPANIFKEVLKYETSNSIVLVHNHPSGDPTPSMNDVNLTARIIRAGKLLNIEVIDHIIIGDGIYTSFRKEEIIRGTNGDTNIDMSRALQKCERR